MLKLKDLKKYYSGKKVFITGHTGFKGAYACLLLKFLNAKVYGYAFKEEKNSIYDILKKENKKLIDKEVYGDIRDYESLYKFMNEVKPDYVFHMAAQPLVIEGYKNPAYTYEVNVLGTVNVMEAVREIYSKSKKKVSVLNVTTDKVYENSDLANYAFTESDRLCGYDPYANSKSCSELVTYSYKNSFFTDKNIFRVSTARAGNVIGGGDISENRIIPDCFRAIKSGQEMLIRNPHSIRPYQYVLEPIILYLNIMAYQMKDKKYEGSYNIGPDKKNCLNTYDIVNRFYDAYSDVCIEHKTCDYIAKVVVKDKSTKKKVLHEASFLRLDNSKIKKVFNYKEIFSMDTCMKYTAEIYFYILKKKKITSQILKYMKGQF